MQWILLRGRFSGTKLISTLLFGRIQMDIPPSWQKWLTDHRGTTLLTAASAILMIALATLHVKGYISIPFIIMEPRTAGPSNPDVPRLPDRFPLPSTRARLPCPNVRMAAQFVQHIDAQLLRVGYQYSYSWYRNGIAVITRPERTDRDGNSLNDPHRWSADIGFFDYYSMFNQIFRAPEGLFRQFIFYFTTENSALFSLDAPRLQELGDWEALGSPGPFWLYGEAFTPLSMCGVLVYEFRAYGAARNVDFIRDSRFDALEHLRRARITW